MRLPFLKTVVSAAVVGIGPVPIAQAQNLVGLEIIDPGDSAVTQRLTLGLNKSTVIDLPRPVADVVITNSGIADATVQSRQRIIFRGVQLGETNAFLFDENGREILNLEISVETDLSELDNLIARHVPEARVFAEAVNGSIILTGSVRDAAEAAQVLDLVNLYETANVVNMMSVAAKDQVLLEVRIVEMSRTFLKQLGIRPNGSSSFGDAETFEAGEVFTGGNDPITGALLTQEQPFANNRALNSDGGFEADDFAGGLDLNLGYQNFVGGLLQSEFSVDIDALERVGVARTLAEPNLTTISGETANFLAGGEFPIQSAPDNNGVSGIEFKQFGIGLGFTPVVLTEDRIALKVATEFSELAAQGAIGGIPSLTTRQVQTSIELPSGRSMMIAGLIQSRTRQELDQIPGIKNVPVLGSLFQSRDFTNDETELVIIITPYLVDSAGKQDLRTPADGFANPSDRDTLLFGRLNQMYSSGDARLDPSTYRAPIGFIEE
ncbi:MAG: type II and III secretion system protein family protein [Pseudomonadota bacterium]